MSLIEVKNLDFSYNETKKVIKNISFDIKKGDYVTIIGHNGSGKSTLARLLIGLLEAKSGSIKIDGLELNEENVYKIREKIGIVFQNPDNQFIGSTVRDDIAFGLENHLVPQSCMDDIINKYAKEVGLEEFLDKEPTALSGGQKQRVAIAGVLAMNPDIIIFDEATSMLDPRGKKDIKDIMRKLHGDGSFTIISITHDIEEVLQSSDCIVLNQGEIFMHDKPSEVFKHADELRKIELDIPFNLKLKEALKREHIKLKGSEIGEMVEELWQLHSNH